MYFMRVDLAIRYSRPTLMALSLPLLIRREANLVLMPRHSATCVRFMASG